MQLQLLSVCVPASADNRDRDQQKHQNKTKIPQHAPEVRADADQQQDAASRSEERFDDHAALRLYAFCNRGRAHFISSITCFR
jgi:hypothetical protein